MSMVLSNKPQSIWTQKCELASQIVGVATAAALPCSTTLTDIFFVLAVALNFLAGNIEAKVRFILNNKIALSLLGFFLMFIVGLSYTTAAFGDAINILFKYDKFLWGALLFPIFIEKRWRNYAIYAFMVVVILMLFLSYLKVLGLLKFDMQEGPIEVFRNHIQFNFLMAMGAYFVLFYIARATRWRRWAGVLLLLLFTYNVLFLCEGRSGYVVFAALWGLFFIQRYNWKIFLLSLVGLGVLLGGAFFFSKAFHERLHYLHDDVSTYQTNPVSSVGTRIEANQNSLKLIKQHPFFGAGTGSFIYDYSHLKPSPAIMVHNPFSEYLYIGVQFGGVGILLLLTMFGLRFWYSRFLAKDLRYLAQAVILAIIVGSFANSWLLDTTEGHFYTYFIALTFATLGCKREPSSARENGLFGEENRN